MQLRRFTYGRCSCAASERKDREQSERAEVCAYQMGRWVLLFSELVRCSHDKIKKIYRFYEQPEIQAGSFTYSYRRDPMCSFADRDCFKNISYRLLLWQDKPALWCSAIDRGDKHHHIVRLYKVAHKLHCHGVCFSELCNDVFIIVLKVFAP